MFTFTADVLPSSLAQVFVSGMCLFKTCNDKMHSSVRVSNDAPMIFRPLLPPPPPPLPSPRGAGPGGWGGVCGGGKKQKIKFIAVSI